MADLNELDPNVISRLTPLISLIASLRQKQQAREQHNQLINELSAYNLNEPAARPLTGEDVMRNYRGAVSQGEGAYPIEQFATPTTRPQVSNLGQLARVIQGIKGLPAEYSSALIGRLTGIEDPSLAQARELIKLRAAEAAPVKEASLKQKEAELERKKQLDEVVGNIKQQQLEMRQQQISGLLVGGLGKLLENSQLPADQRQALTQMMLKFYLDQLGLKQEATTPTAAPSGVTVTRIK